MGKKLSSRRSPLHYGTPPDVVSEVAPEWAGDLASLYTSEGIAGDPNLVDHVSGLSLMPTTSTLPYWDTGQFGVGIYVPVSSGVQRTGAIRWQPQDHGGFQPLTIMWFGRWDSSSQSGANIAGYYSASGPRVHFYTTGATAANVTFRLSNTVNVAGPLVFGAFDTLVLVATMRSATDLDFGMHYLGGSGSLTGFGKIDFATSSSNVGSAAAQITAENIGHAQPTTAGFTTATMTYVYASWTRGMARDEMAALLNNPRGILRNRFFPGAYPQVATAVTGDLAATLDADTVTALGSVPVVGTLAATLAGDTVASTADVELYVTLEATLAGDVVSATGYPGEGAIGVLGDTPIILEDDAVDATATVDLFGDLAVTLDADLVAAFAVSGTNGPFERRRMVVLNP
jgi:hypothetical protein